MRRLESCCDERGPPGTLNDIAKPANIKSKTLASVYPWNGTLEPPEPKIVHVKQQSRKSISV